MNYNSSHIIRFKFLLALFFCWQIGLSQSFEVSVSGIKEGDSIRLVVQKSSEYFFKEWVHYNTDGPSTATFSDLVEGQWALSIDATGYTFPSTLVFDFPETTSASVVLTPLLNDNYTYNWRDDGSAAGHSTQSYIAEPTEIIVLNDTVSVPTGFSAIKLRNEYGILLSDDVEPWSNEDAYRLYKMFTNLPYHPYGEGSEVDYTQGDNVRGVFYLSNDEIFEDIAIETVDGIKHATVSQSAFTYAEPQIVKLDGIRGKFFSKRLYHTVINFITDFARDQQMVDWIARERFGIEFLKPGDFLEDLMSEDRSNFQEFYNTEKLEILATFEELPEGFHKQDGLKYLVRRIDGQEHPDPTYRPAAAIAWTGLNTIEFIYKAFASINGESRNILSDVRRLILHEKAHFLWAYSFDDTTKDDWVEIGGWFEDPTSGTGWSTYNTTEFVSAYAHAKNPNEDMAESIAIYLTNPDKLINVSIKKYEFIRDRIMHGTRYVAQIREDLTFTVYNLFPDYVYPGKIIGIELEVNGKSDEDKIVQLKVTLDSDDPQIDGGIGGYFRFASSIGTIFDIPVSPVNGTIDSVLTGQGTLSKFAKNGYWNLVSARIWDQANNQRYENTSTIGMKLYIENPSEDIIPPKFLDFESELVEDRFTKFNTTNGRIDSEGDLHQAIKLSTTIEEENDPLRYNGSILRIDFPNPEQSETYFKEVYLETQTPNIVEKKLEGFFLIEEYYPTGYYSFIQMYTADVAQNFAYLTFQDNPENFNETPGNQAIVRDSVYVETEFPDIIKPEIDLNNIEVSAAPTNPNAPNGETRVDINFNARDLSDYPGHESGVYKVSLTLQDPQGNRFGYQTGNSTMNHPDLDHWDTSPAFNSDWKNYRFDLVLPAGSAPGLWGISDITILDKVGNTRNYNFVEYVRFDVIESDIVLDEPLEIEIIDKVINANNVDSLSVKLSCVPCAGLGYVATIYSRFGGGAVVRNEGTLNANEVVLDNLNTTGILDGEVNLTVQLVDGESNLIATKTTAYTKDVVYPSAYYTRSNLQDEGQSNLDDLTIDIEYNSEDEGGSYNYETGQATTSGIRNSLKGSKGYPSINFSISPSSVFKNYTGELIGDVIIDNLELSDSDLGLIYGKLTVIDPNGNKGQQEVVDYFVLTIDETSIERIKKYRDNDIDFDEDGVLNEQDAFPYDATESIDTDEDGIGNNADTDDDGDGVLDTEDAFPLDATEAYDADGDGIGDNADDDDDNDQIKDVNDECPNSALGVTVDAKGCEVFALPSNTFTVSVTSATCPDSSNGSITISSSNTEYSYRYAIDNQAPQALTDNTQTISNLSAGIYTVCVTVDGVADYQRCYTIEIAEPSPLVASSRIDMSSRNMQLDLSGSEEYQVTINGKTFLTTEDRLSLNLEPGMNRVEVTTALDCQGVYFEEIFVSEEVKVYPNPTPGPLQLFVAGSDSEVEMSITSLSGGVLRRETLAVPANRIIETSLGNLPEGLYLITLNGTTVKTTHKVIKE